MANPRIVGQRISAVAVVVMAVHVVRKTTTCSHEVFFYVGCVGLRTADPFRLLEEMRDSTMLTSS